MENKLSKLSIIGEPYRAFEPPTYKYKRTFVEAVCECGNVKTYRHAHLKNGSILSCGCLSKQVLIERNTTHGLINDPLYGTWSNMKNRCYTKTNPGYKNYGERGITVCEEWKNDFVVFRNWALSKGWSPSLEIDREDNDGNYEPNNCRIVTSKENSRNKRNTLRYEKVEQIKSLYKKGRITMLSLGKMFGVSETAISAIIHKKTWT